MKKIATNVAPAKKNPSPGTLGPSGSVLESLLSSQLQALGLNFVREYRFHPKRKWRFDFAAPELKVALEVEGGVWRGGRHNRGAGLVGDIEKYNQGAMAGWTVLRFTDRMIKTGQAVRMVEQYVNERIIVTKAAPAAKEKRNG